MEWSPPAALAPVAVEDDGSYDPSEVVDVRSISVVVLCGDGFSLPNIGPGTCP